MTDKGYVGAILKEAELYRSQGLLEESRESYLKLLAHVRDEQGYDNDKLIAALHTRIDRVEKSLSDMGDADELPELSQELQDLIMKLFSFSRSSKNSALEGAVALMQFGQYERALERFEEFMVTGTCPLVAAKNILLCRLNLSTADSAVTLFRQWLSEKKFSMHDLGYLGRFLENQLVVNGCTSNMPLWADGECEADFAPQGDFGRISSIIMQIPNGPLKGKMVDFDVGFQSRNVICVTIPHDRRSIADHFRTGIRLPVLQIYCFVDAILKNSGMVSDKMKIIVGPNQGDYDLEIILEEEWSLGL